MKKLTMDLETLTVDSFETAEVDAGARGTVQGRDAAAAISLGPITYCGCKPWYVVEPHGKVDIR